LERELTLSNYTSARVDQTTQCKGYQQDSNLPRWLQYLWR